MLIHFLKAVPFLGQLQKTIQLEYFSVNQWQKTGSRCTADLYYRKRKQNSIIE